MTIERKIAKAFALDDDNLDASRQPVERGPAQHRAADSCPRILEPALARMVCPRSGCPCPSLDMV